MIVEYTYSAHDLKKRCFGCKWLNKRNDFEGKCECLDNYIKRRDRSVTDKACRYKEYEVNP